MVKEEFDAPSEGKLALHGSKFELACFSLFSLHKATTCTFNSFLTSIIHTAPSDEVKEEFDAPSEGKF